MNNHFATYHLYDLIKSYGPLRYYSCRSLERTIQKYTNLSRSKSQPIKETDNIFVRLNYFKKFNEQMPKKDQYPARKGKPDSFKNHPLDYTGSQAQLWEKFEEIDFDQHDEIVDIPAQSIYQAIQKYFERTSQQDNIVVSKKTVLSARLLKGSTVFQSKWHYGKQDPKRSNHSVIFEVKESLRLYFLIVDCR